MALSRALMHHTPVYSFPCVPPTTTTFFNLDDENVGDDPSSMAKDMAGRQRNAVVTRVE